ncbi:MAG TPA: winged helix-turn-helix domain-containing protein [Polyangiaceae bacterium]|nr:winged helix-turn-helix domain-containing protein [Polyangiaceae bacterium]
MHPLVLVVQDEPQPRLSLASVLASHGFRMLHAGPGGRAFMRASGHQPDLVLVDAGDRGGDVLTLTRRLREWTASPIVVLLPRDLEHESAQVLDAGASDYVLKPFATSDLLSRMRVWLHQTDRTRGLRASPEPKSDRIRIDRERRAVFVEGREVHVTPLECKLLLALARSPGKPIPEQQLLVALWGHGASTRVQHLRAHVRQLRQKIERDPARPRHLVTDAAGAYRLTLR